MKRFPAIMILLFFGTLTFGQKKPDKYFEGVIEYEIKTKSHIPGVSDNEMRERMGAKLMLHYKNGTYMREYIDGAGYTLNRQYYFKDKNIMCMHNVMYAPDTLYTLDPTEKLFSDYTVTKGETEKILGVDCPSAVISARFFSPYIGDTTTITMIYYFSYDLPVDPAWSRNVYLWKDVIAEHHSIATKFIEDDPVISKQTFTAVKVTWQLVADEIFKLDPKLVQVKAPK